jgi:hypothetical protein
MADDKKIEVPAKLIAEMQEQMAALEKKNVDFEAKLAGIEQMNEKEEDEGPKLRKKKDFSPKFRTVFLRKYPIAGDIENKGIVVGYTSRGAYQTIDKSGITPQIVDRIDVIFLGKEKGKDGKLLAESVPLLDLINKSEPVVCKILEEKRTLREVPTGEEMSVRTYDPQHGLIETGETVDGYVVYTDLKFKLQVPGFAEPVEIDSKYCN